MNCRSILCLDLLSLMKLLMVDIWENSSTTTVGWSSVFALLRLMPEGILTFSLFHSWGQILFIRLLNLDVLARIRSFPCICYKQCISGECNTLLYRMQMLVVNNSSVVVLVLVCIYCRSFLDRWGFPCRRSRNFRSLWRLFLLLWRSHFCLLGLCCIFLHHRSILCSLYLCFWF